MQAVRSCGKEKLAYVKNARQVLVLYGMAVPVGGVRPQGQHYETERSADPEKCVYVI